MAQHYIDPNDYDVDEDVTHLFADHGNSATVEATVREDATHGKYIELYSSAGAGPTFLEHLASNGDVGTDEVEVLIKEEITSQSNSMIYCLGRADNTRSGFGASFFGGASSDCRLNIFDNSTFVGFGSTSNKNFSNGTIIWQLLRVTSSGPAEISGRFWEDGTSKPASTDAFGTSTNFADGFAGIAFYTDNDRTLYHLYWLGIGTNGDDAPDSPTTTGINGTVTQTLPSINQSAEGAGGALFPTGWDRRVKLTIQSSQVNVTVSDFPVLITRSNLPDEVCDPSSPNAAQADGGDLRVTTNTDFILPL